MQLREQEPVERLALVFDTECRPMHYNEWRPESQLTAYAWEWVLLKGELVFEPAASGKSGVLHDTAEGLFVVTSGIQAVDSGLLHGGVLEQNKRNERDLLEDFLAAYDRADMVIGHYIRRHDLPLINDHAVRLGCRPISERPQKLVQDTKMDFVKVKALGLSQDNLSETFELGREEGGTRKHHMAGGNWRVANSLDPEGRNDSWERVSSDVVQNLQLYLELKRRNALRAPLRWPETVRRHPR